MRMRVNLLRVLACLIAALGAVAAVDQWGAYLVHSTSGFALACVFAPGLIVIPLAIKPVLLAKSLAVLMNAAFYWCVVAVLAQYRSRG